MRADSECEGRGSTKGKRVPRPSGTPEGWGTLMMSRVPCGCRCFLGFGWCLLGNACRGAHPVSLNVGWAPTWQASIGGKQVRSKKQRDNNAVPPHRKMKKLSGACRHVLRYPDRDVADSSAQFGVVSHLRGCSALEFTLYTHTAFGGGAPNPVRHGDCIRRASGRIAWLRWVDQAAEAKGRAALCAASTASAAWLYRMLGLCG